MQENSTTPNTSPAGARPRPAPVSPKDARQLLYLFFLVPGVALSVFASAAYPLLDARVPQTLMLLGVLLPAAYQGYNLVRRRSGGYLRRVRAVYLCSGSALVLLALVLFMNGRLDRSPRSPMHATVLRKLAIPGSHGKEYHLAVSSLPHGGRSEDLQVASPVYERAKVGRPVTIQVRRGFFGLPWSAGVSD